MPFSGDVNNVLSCLHAVLMSEVAALGVDEAGMRSQKALSSVRATTSKPSAGFRGFFVTPPPRSTKASQGDGAKHEV
jgi:hypothetical protein